MPLTHAKLVAPMARDLGRGAHGACTLPQQFHAMPQVRVARGIAAQDIALAQQCRDVCRETPKP
jgi:hypothetical protein